MITDLDALRRLLDLPESVGRNDAAYPLRVPRHFVDRMEKGNPNDPLLLQILPRVEESETAAGFSRDPLDECPAGSASLQKYAGRRLLLVTPRCGVHCRFCFRRHTLKSFESKDFETMLQSIRRDPTITEVILSGGDPLMLVDAELKRLLHYIVKIPHVKRIRLHSRLPIVLPSRVTRELGEMLASLRSAYLVVHVNHPNELSDEVLAGFQRLSGIPILSQTVLLKDINDNEETLFGLFDRLADHRVIPYYLHQLDRVQGAAHFEVAPEVGKRLIETIQRRLPGYAVPKYVREVVGAESKQNM